MLQGVIAFGMPNARSTYLYAGATPTTSRNRAIRWVGDNHVASLRDCFLYCSFLCLSCSVSEDSHCHMRGSDVVNLEMPFWLCTVESAHVARCRHGQLGVGLWICSLRT